MTDRLADILATTRAEVARRKQAALAEAVAFDPDAHATIGHADAIQHHDAVLAAPPRGFLHAIEARIASGGLALIAEIKRASPSKGLIRADFDPAAHARAYAAGGATCLSVLTDSPYFHGSLDDLRTARAAVDLPVLRKDFMIDPWQVEEARAHGADAILLIVAALEDARLADLEAAALDLAMDVLIEVHDEQELERALRFRSRLIGVNNRDLRTFETDHRRAWSLAARVPPGYTVVSESGLATHADLAAAAEHGIRAFLVGEALMRQPDIAAATRALLGA